MLSGPQLSNKSCFVSKSFDFLKVETAPEINTVVPICIIDRINVGLI